MPNVHHCSDPEVGNDNEDVEKLCILRLNVKTVGTAKKIPKQAIINSPSSAFDLKRRRKAKQNKTEQNKIEKKWFLFTYDSSLNLKQNF